MPMEKSFNDFIRIHERKLMTTDVDLLENNLTAVTNRASSILGAEGGDDLQEAISKLIEGLNMFQKVLVKHELYELL